MDPEEFTKLRAKFDREKPIKPYKFNTINRWIKCSDRMPEDTALAYDRKGRIIMARYYPSKTTKCKDGFYTSTAEWIESGCCGRSIKPEEITHWMPLPKLPLAPEKDNNGVD